MGRWGLTAHSLGSFENGENAEVQVLAVIGGLAV